MRTLRFKSYPVTNLHSGGCRECKKEHLWRTVVQMAGLRFLSTARRSLFSGPVCPFHRALCT